MLKEGAGQARFRRIVVAVGLSLALVGVTGVAASAALTRHQKAQLRTWGNGVLSALSTMAADVSNLAGQNLASATILCENLTQDLQPLTGHRKPPVASMTTLWKATLKFLGTGGNNCVGGQVAPATSELKKGTTDLGSLVKTLQGVGVNVSIPGPPAGDVSITQCQVDPNDDTTADIAGTIVNHTTVTNDYDLSMNILQGSVRVGSAVDDESNIAPGQTSTWSTFGDITGGNGGAITCPIVSIERTPSSG